MKLVRFSPFDACIEPCLKSSRGLHLWGENKTSLGGLYKFSRFSTFAKKASSTKFLCLPFPPNFSKFSEKFFALNSTFGGHMGIYIYAAKPHHLGDYVFWGLIVIPNWCCRLFLSGISFACMQLNPTGHALYFLIWDLFSLFLMRESFLRTRAIVFQLFF